MALSPDSKGGAATLQVSVITPDGLDEEEEEAIKTEVWKMVRPLPGAPSAPAPDPPAAETGQGEEGADQGRL